MIKREFYPLDVELTKNENISLRALVLHAKLTSMLALSQGHRDRYYDPDRQQCFVFFKRAKICRLLRCSKQVATDALRELTALGLISLHRIRRGPYRIYVNELPNNLHKHEDKSTSTELTATSTETPWKDQRPTHHTRTYMREYFEEQIEYDWLQDQCHTTAQETLLRLIVDVMVGTYCSNTNTYKIGCDEISAKGFAERLKHLEAEHIWYIVEQCCERKMKYPRQYILRCLYTAKEDYEASLIGLMD